jgi:hypothetical protein
MRHFVKYWDKSRGSPIPVAIDFLAAESLSDAAEMAAKRLRDLNEKYGARVGFCIEDEAGHSCRTWRSASTPG